MIDMIDMIVVPRVARRKIWSAVTRTALCAGRACALPPHSCSKSGVARNTACRRT